VSATTVAQALPYVNWIVLTALALGTFAFAVIAHHTSDVTRGYVGFTLFVAAVLAALVLASDLGLPDPTGLVIKPATPDIDLARRVGLGDIAIVSVIYIVALRSRWTPLLAAVGLVSGVSAIIAAAVGWAPTIVDSVSFAVQLGILSAVTGGALAGIILGHWYLVTPKLSERPLVLQARLLLAAVLLQTLLFVVWATLGGGVGQDAFAALTGSSALLVWLRGLITLVFPLVLIYMALRTAQTRSMESATGLLYINLAAVAAGTIGAAALYVTNGLLV
jgi:hypothetical protein